MAKRVDDNIGTPEYIFAHWAPVYEALDYVVAPILEGTKRPACLDWAELHPSTDQKLERHRLYPACGIGWLAGAVCPDGTIVGFLDNDNEKYLPFLLAVVGNVPSAKKGQKGLTIFCRFVPGTRSMKFRAFGGDRPAVEVNVDTGQTVLPPSRHPAGMAYAWVGTPLHEIARTSLPLVEQWKLEIIKLVLANESAAAIVNGGGGLAGHDLMLKLASCGVANLTDNLEWLAACLNRLFQNDYQGNTKDETLEMLRSAKAKNLGANRNSSGKGPTAAEVALAALDVAAIQTFHSSLMEGYATVGGSQGGRFTFKIRSTAFGMWLKRQYFVKTQKPMSKSTFEEIIDLLEAQALFNSPQEPIFLRYAKVDGNVYVDLGDDLGRVAVITPTGWSVAPETNIKFRRATGMKALPVPVAGGDINRLNELLGLNKENWICVLAFILNCLNAGGPFFCLLIEAEQGSGKSVLAAFLKRLIDPSLLERVRLPDGEHDLILQAQESALLNFDNASHIKPRISDALCSLATRSAFGTRKYYTDNELRLIESCCPFILNGIGEYARRPDLLNRAIPLKLPPFEGARRSEADLFATFEELLPELLGSLFSIVSHALRHYENAETPTSIRMADAAKWLVAAETACGLPEGTFVDVLTEAQSNLMADVVINDPLTLALLKLVESKPFDGLMGKLCEDLRMLGDKDRGLPSTPAHLSQVLRRLAPAWKNIGLHVEFGGKSQKGKQVRVWLENIAIGGSAAGRRHEY